MSTRFGMDIKTIQAFCLALPGSKEDLKWENDLCYCVADKIYAVLGVANDPVSLCFKTTPELFEVLIQREGIEPAPYLARYKWVRLDHMRVMAREELETHLRASYHLVFSKLPKKARWAIESGT